MVMVGLWGCFGVGVLVWWCPRVGWGRLDLPAFPVRGVAEAQGSRARRRHVARKRDAKHPGGLRGGPVSFAGTTTPAAAQPPPLSLSPGVRGG